MHLSLAKAHVRVFCACISENCLLLVTKFLVLLGSCTLHYLTCCLFAHRYTIITIEHSTFLGVWFAFYATTLTYVFCQVVLW